MISAGFRKLVGDGFLAAFGDRYLNTHNSLLPAFPGIHGPRDALTYGVKVAGATLFFVDAAVPDDVVDDPDVLPRPGVAQRAVHDRGGRVDERHEREQMHGQRPAATRAPGDPAAGCPSPTRHHATH